MLSNFWLSKKKQEVLNQVKCLYPPRRIWRRFHKFV